eukprot:SAG31_NODE_10563_length_1124_cov_1.057561_1_plen_225_part_00
MSSIELVVRLFGGAAAAFSRAAFRAATERAAAALRSAVDLELVWATWAEPSKPGASRTRLMMRVALADTRASLDLLVELSADVFKAAAPRELDSPAPAVRSTAQQRPWPAAAANSSAVRPPPSRRAASAPAPRPELQNRDTRSVRDHRGSSVPQSAVREQRRTTFEQQSHDFFVACIIMYQNVSECIRMYQNVSYQRLRRRASHFAHQADQSHSGAERGSTILF